MLGALFPKGRLQRPPAYFTPDWDAVESSVRRLARLAPEIIVTGHGPAAVGQEVREALQDLAGNFTRLGSPSSSRHLSQFGN